MLKKISGVILFFAAVLIAANFKLVLYGIQQLRGQLHIVNNARPVSEVLADGSIPDSIKIKLGFIEEIKRFAVDSLSLKPSDNYTTFYDQQSKPVMWVLTAAPPFKMESHTWYYPFLGRLSYKGFFDKDKGLTEKLALAKTGLETDLSPTGGWSTLGWFRDPVLSNMLKKGEGALAELIIHELTHGTLYIKGDVEFNENLATFMGEKGAIQYLEAKYGKASLPFKIYRERSEDEDVYSKYILGSMEKLNVLYDSLATTNLNAKEKYFLKYRRIAEIMCDVGTLPLHNRSRYEWDLSKGKLPDNTYFLAYSNYRRKQANLEEVFNKIAGGDLKKLIAYYKSAHGK